MEILSDGKYNLIETNHLIVKNMTHETLFIDKELSEYDSGSLYLIDNSKNNIIISLPYRKTGVFFEFIFINTNNNSIEFKTAINPIDNSKFIGTDWLYLKRSDINISYSTLTGTSLKFNKSEHGEYIKFYCDGTNYYIIEKNDTNNNINNIISYFPSTTSLDYIVNINLQPNGSYLYNIINEKTNEPINTLYIGNTYNFKFNTSSNEYNTITNLSSKIIYNIYTYIDNYDKILYNIDTIFDTTTNKYILDISTKTYYYTYPILNYYILDINRKRHNTLNLLDTTYLIDLYNNTILYPTYNYNEIINNNISNNILDSNTSILNIYYDILNKNLIIYDENNNILYDHNFDRRFILVNRDIKYTLNYFIKDINSNYEKIYTSDAKNSTFQFSINTLDTDLNLITYVQNNYFKFTTNTLENNTFIINIPTINSTNQNKNIYYLLLKYNETSIEKDKKIFIIPLLFLDHIILNKSTNSSINFSKQNKNILNTDIIDSYEFSISSSTTLTNDNFVLSLLNTNLTDTTINSVNIFTLMTQKLKIPIIRDKIDNYLLKFLDNEKNIYNTSISTDGIYKNFNLSLSNSLSSDIKLNYYSELQNISGGQFNIKSFLIDDMYSGKLLLMNLKTDLYISLENVKQGNLFDIIINNDNSIDSNTYKLTKQKNVNGYEKYYFIKNNEETTLLENITLYTSNTYSIIIDKNTIKTDEIINNKSLENDLFQFSDYEDGILNGRQNKVFKFIKKNIETNNTIQYIFTIPEFNIPSKLYYYNKTKKKWVVL